MAKSPPRGTTSCSSIRPLAEVTGILASLAETAPLRAIIEALNCPEKTFIVGGTVRDALVGVANTDLDLAVHLSAPECLRRLTHAHIHCLEVGVQHGTVIAVVGGESVEISSLRGGGDTTSDALARDLELRDFTINAIAFSLSEKVLHDPLNGIEDLQSSRLRTPGVAHLRFEEDPLRILRLVRFGPAQGRTVHPDTLAGALSAAEKLRAVSVERIRNELDRILLSAHPGEALRALRDWGLLTYTVPELEASVGFEQNRYHIEDVFNHTVTVVERAPSDRLLRWIALFHDMGKPASLTVDEEGRHFYGHEILSEQLARTAMKRLKFSHDDADAIASVVRHHMRPVDCGVPGTRRILRDLGEHYELWRHIKVADAPPILPDSEYAHLLKKFDEQVNAERERLKGSVYGKLAINGEDLKSLGVQPGPAMGAILRKIEDRVIEDPEMNERERLLSLAKDLVAGTI